MLSRVNLECYPELYACELTVGVDDSIVLGEKVLIAVAYVSNAINKIK